MDFEWDNAKSKACFQERGFDFAYAARAFLDPGRQIRPDLRYSYGEDRYQLVGSIEGRLFLVAFTHRQQAIRIISARKANQREVKQYDNSANED